MERDSRRPRWLQHGHEFVNKNGETVTPVHFFHPCWKEGCIEYAAHGVGVALLKSRGGRWSCRAHLHELLTLVREDEASNPDGGTPDDSSNGNRTLFDE